MPCPSPNPPGLFDAAATAIPYFSIGAIFFLILIWLNVWRAKVRYSAILRALPTAPWHRVFGAAYLGVALFCLGLFVAVWMAIWGQEIKDWDNSFIAAYYLNCPNNFSAYDQANRLMIVLLFVAAGIMAAAYIPFGYTLIKLRKLARSIETP